MKYIFTTDAGWLERWDHFVLNEDKGSHLILSDWLKSYNSYGFEFEVCLALDDDKIVGGFGAVVAKALMFRFYIVPFGPIASTHAQHIIEPLITEVRSRAIFHNACYAHVTLPVSAQLNNHVYDPLAVQNVVKNIKEGHLFKYVYSGYGLNWVDLRGYENEDAILDGFRTYVRRNVRASLRKDLEMKFLESDDELKQGYELCLENADQNNYSLRDWNSFRPTLKNLIASGKGKFVAAFKDDQLKGCILLVKGGKYFTYILGGTVKEKPDLLVGHFLQWQAIKLSFENGYDGYNISLGGSPGILEFKSGYASDQIYFTDSKYHWILKPVQFKLFLFVEKYLKRHKQTISKILSKMK